MKHAYICDAVRTPFGRYGGALASIRAGDLGALPLKELVNTRGINDPTSEAPQFLEILRKSQNLPGSGIARNVTPRRKSNFFL